MLTLYNTITRRKELFAPTDPGHVKMYVCGPTVYERPHLGNARSVVVYDVLFRVLQAVYPAPAQVTYVRNITDVDDKINAAAKAKGEPISALAERVVGFFHEDMDALNVLRPTEEPRATAHIPEMIAMIERLIANGNAYASEGHVLFSVKTDPNYGALSGRNAQEQKAGARVEVEAYKHDAGDFVLWKPSSADEPGWDSPWGYGRPGWHIECSAMACEYLGENFDIHGGGADLKFPHHENEIAQATCANPHSHYATTWVHNGFLLVNGEKMSKSEGNFITVRELLDKGISGEVIRYALLSTHYSQPLNWTEKLLEDAKKALDRLYQKIPFTAASTSEAVPDSGVLEALREDLNTPMALAKLLALKHDPTTLKVTGKLLGFFQEERTVINESDPEIEAQIAARTAAKKARDFALADQIRAELLAQGIVLEDKPGGITEWRRA